uniref:Cx9C motif-containing protein 4 n=1 Tax=Anopheles christyi TaxID=43041 RepID=A0A182JRE5_9DIPT
MSKSKPKDPCKPAACRIQTCLREHSYDEVKCYDVIEDMRQCCLKWHKIVITKPKRKASYESEKQPAREMHADPRRPLRVPKRNWFQRNPRTFSSLVTGTALLIFFSKPLYDAFIADAVPGALPPREIRSIRIGPK